MIGSFKITALISHCLLILLVACAPAPEDINLDCVPGTSQLCSAHSRGGQITWKTENLRPNEEFIIAIMSRETTQSLETFQHSISIVSDVASSPRPREEQLLIDRVLREQGTKGSGFESDLDESIQAPRSNFYLPENIDTYDFYVPHPRDYVARREDRIFPFYVHNPSGDRLSGKKLSFSRFDSNPQNFDLFYDGRLRDSQSPQRFDEYSRGLSDCLKRIVPKTLDLIGQPFDLDGKPEINMIITKFEGNLGGRTLGLFSSIDRFKYYGKDVLADSNYGENVYLAPRYDSSKSCATAAHELQHMVSFDYKVLSQLPENERSNMKAKEKRGLNPEELGLDEAYSHFVEWLTEERTVVGDHLYNFFTSPQQASFALETQYTNLLGNSRSRGANTLTLLYALKKAGGTLNAQDPSTQEFLSSLITSPHTGFENIALYFNQSEDEFLDEFFHNLLMSLYDSTFAAGFLPPIETRKISETKSIVRGFKILDRSTPFEKIPFRSPEVHPFQFPLQNLTFAENSSIPAQGMRFYRFSTASVMPAKSEILFSTQGSPFSVFIVKPR